MAQSVKSTVPATSTGKVKITLVKSAIGCGEKQIKTVQALGLKKIRSFTVQNDSPTLRGMIFTVKHLVAVEEV